MCVLTESQAHHAIPYTYAVLNTEYFECKVFPHIKIGSQSMFFYVSLFYSLLL